jgi:hypothetical protein
VLTNTSLGLAETRLKVSSESEMSHEKFTKALLGRLEINPQEYTLDLFVTYERGEDHIKINTADTFDEWLSWHRNKGTSKVLCMQSTQDHKCT